MLWSVFQENFFSLCMCRLDKTLPFITFVHSIFACNALPHLTATHLCNSISPVHEGSLLSLSGIIFAWAISLLFSSFPSIRDWLQQKKGISESTEKSPQFTEHLVHHSQGSTYLGTEEIFPPTRGGRYFWLSAFSTALSVEGHPPGDPSSYPPRGVCACRVMVYAFDSNIQTNWSLWSWHRILDRRVMVCFTSLY